MVELEPEDRRKLEENARELILCVKAPTWFLPIPKYLRGLNSDSEVSVDCLFDC